MLKVLLRLTGARVALALLAVIAVLTVLGPWLAPFDPLQGSDVTLADPSPRHWLGTDYLGRDVLSRILAGAPLSILSTLQVAGIALVLGTIPGVLSVYLGSVFEWLSLRVVDTLVALPFLVFAVAMTALLGNGITQAMVAVGLLVAPLFYRVARAATLSVARAPYVEAALLAGASTGWIVRRHVWAKVAPPVAITLAGTLGVGLVVISSLTFLGIGVQPPTPTWGGILASDLEYLSQKPYAPVFPTVLILVTVLALNLLADALRDASGAGGRVLVGAGEARTRRARRLAASPRPTPTATPTPPTPHDAPLIVTDLRVHDDLSDTELVHGVSFRLERGGVVGIVGESGSGKSLTCRAVLGILPPLLEVSGGTITLLGRDTARLGPREWTALRGASIGAVFQDPASYLNPSITVGRQLQEVLRVRGGLDRAAAERRAIELFHAVRLRDPERVHQQYVHELSGGMLQRVLIAIAVSLEPDILIADEPTTALDATVQAEILDLLAELAQRLGLSVVLVSHDLAVVAQLCNEVLVMRDGHVVEQGPTAQILQHPRAEYTRLLVAEHQQYGLERHLGATPEPTERELDHV